jgi:hypothetical protein
VCRAARTACFSAAIFGLMLCGPARGQAGAHFLPEGDEFIVHQATTFSQYQPKVALRPDGEQIVFTWVSAVGTDVYARVFDGQGKPLTGDLFVNDSQTVSIQDDPTVAIAEDGRFLVAWGDRQGYDGEQIGVFARLYAADGQPLTGEFQVNVQWQQSQWEPYAAALPGGGWVVGWTGNDNGRTYMRLLAADGTPETGEIEVASDNMQQLCPVPAVTRDGTIFFGWIDFGGKGGVGNGTSIFGRLFDSSGVPLGPEFMVNTTYPGEQRAPKTAADALGRFIVVWEDRQADAEGTDIHARRYDATGSPISDEWRVNTTAAGDQLYPEVTADWVGNLLVTWEDHSAGQADVRGQRYDAAGDPVGGEFVVNLSGASDQGFPDVATSWSGESWVFCYTTLNSTLDVAAQRYRFAPLTPVGPAMPGATLELELDLPSGAGLQYLLLLSLGTSPGLPLPDGRTLQLNYDPLMAFVLANPDGGGAFHRFLGLLPADPSASAAMDLPPNANLVGLPLQFAVVTLDLGQVGLANQLRHVTDPLEVVIE